MVYLEHKKSGTPFFSLKMSVKTITYRKTFAFASISCYVFWSYLATALLQIQTRISSFTNQSFILTDTPERKIAQKQKKQTEKFKTTMGNKKNLNVSLLRKLFFIPQSLKRKALKISKNIVILKKLYQVEDPGEKKNGSFGFWVLERSVKYLYKMY